MPNGYNSISSLLKIQMEQMLTLRRILKPEVWDALEKHVLAENNKRFGHFRDIHSEMELKAITDYVIRGQDLSSLVHNWALNPDRAPEKLRPYLELPEQEKRSYEPARAGKRGLK